VGTVALIALGAGAAFLLRSSSSQASLSDHAAELRRIDGELQKLGSKSAAFPLSVERSARQLALLQRYAALTGGAADEVRARAAADEALGRLGPAPDLLLLGVDHALRVHDVPRARSYMESLVRLGDAALSERGLQARPREPSSPPADPPRYDRSATALALRSDLAVQEGDYAMAQRTCEEALRKRRDWAMLARLAHLELFRGNATTADGLYAEAEDDLSAKEMHAYAWIEQERGFLWLNRGRYDRAAVHYENADRAYSGDWRLMEHKAELLAADRHFDEAVALYEEALARAPRPEIEQALGDLLVFVGRARAARVWHDRALSGYLASVERGEVQYFHHLAGFYADVRMDGPTALTWARRDAALRQNAYTQDALAWALFRAGRFAEARVAMGTALVSGVRDAHLFFHAAMVNLAAGYADDGRRFLAEAAEMNPHYEAFHAHR
jgi:tetratricopeptide (TPR) repeat protein